MKTEINEAAVKAILAKVEAGQSERSACEEEGMNRATFRAQALKMQAGDQYARVLAALAESQVEKMEVTLQDMRDGIIDAAQARVEIDARKWFASKFLPKRYGDKLELAGDAERPLTVNITRLTDTSK